MSTKPTIVPTWATSGPLTVPSAAKQLVGFIPGERGSAQYFNFLFQTNGQWCQYLNDGALQGVHSIDPVVAGTALTTKAGVEAQVVPQLVGKSWDGRARATVDHLGFRGGQLSELEEHWRTAAVSSDWSLATSGGTLGPVNPSSTFTQRQLQYSLASAQTASLYSNAFAFMDADTQLSLEFQLRVAGAIPTSGFHEFGFWVNATTGGFAFRHTQASANWRAVKIVSLAISQDLDTGVAVALSTNYRCRIEIIGPNLNSIGGTTYVIRFYINGTLVQTMTSTGFSGLVGLYTSAGMTTVTGTATWGLGRMRLVWNHVPTQDPI